jgi:saccharopine dehydrogenase-like NADP-dependent oxidoreductase
MKKVLVLGAGRSAYCLIHYLIEHAATYNWTVLVGDADLPALHRRFPDHARLEKFRFDVAELHHIEGTVAKADLVISMLPARFHPLVAKPCLRQGKHLLTASYISDDMKAMHEEAKKMGLIFLNEMGLDPGIDHLSALKIINELKEKGATITLFKSYTGGLIAPESDNNPWNYKFTWNPRNVVLAGQGTAQYIGDGAYKYIPYHQLFSRTEQINIEGYGAFEGYPNRDSLKYREVYGLNNIPTMLRGTLRRKGFCKSWNHFVQLGMTDDTYAMEGSESMTYKEFVNSFLPEGGSGSVEERLATFIGDRAGGEEMQKIAWLGLFSDEAIGLHNASPAQVLQQVLERKWVLEPHDKDMTVMQHVFEYTLGGQRYELTSSMVIIGEDGNSTAMAKGVGYPLAIAAKMILTGRFAQAGVLYPMMPALYEPVLAELEQMGVRFTETVKQLA